MLSSRTLPRQAAMDRTLLDTVRPLAKNTGPQGTSPNVQPSSPPPDRMQRRLNRVEAKLRRKQLRKQYGHQGAKRRFGDGYGS